jgi:4-hydroxy-tetrahydrodipicolinate synthase
MQTCARRDFLRLAGGAVAAAVRAYGAEDARRAKPLRGIFPIAQTPFTGSNKLDIDVLVEELRFIDRAGVHGFVWPQLASEWSTLTREERLEGTKAVASAGRGLRPAVVIGVQSADTATAVQYAKHAAEMGADAIISLPPKQTAPRDLLEYYKQVGKATPLPFFLQAVGDMPVELIVEMYRAAPTLRYLKDEAGEPLFRIGPLREKTGGNVNVFTGSHGKTLIDEMRRGFAGSMPAASFADLYASTWDLWHAGDRKAAMDIFSQASMLIHEVGPYGLEGLKYILELRGVFKTHHTRSGKGRLDEDGKQTIRAMLEYVKPHLRA